MADNTPIRVVGGSTVQAATDELADSSQSPKVTLLSGTGSATPITMPLVIGQGTMAQSFKVVLPSDQSAVATKGGPVTLTDGSTNITTGGTAQNAVASNASRRYLQIANPDTTRILYFNMTGTAAVGTAGNTALGPGSSVIWEQTVPTGAVSIIGAATGQPFTVKEG